MPSLGVNNLDAGRKRAGYWVEILWVMVQQQVLWGW